jgi:hypothetical protein
VEEPKSFVILEDIGIEANMDYIADLGEPTNVFEGQLLHFARSQTPLCLKIYCLCHVCLQGRHDGKSHWLIIVNPTLLFLTNIYKCFVSYGLWVCQILFLGSF